MSQNSLSQQPQSLLAVGTSQQYGEDYPCTGRLLLFAVRTPEEEGEDWAAELILQRCATAKAGSRDSV